VESNPDMLEDQRSRAVAAADIAAFALERDLPHMALGAAREAARSALLALAVAPRRLPDPDLVLLREMAAASPQHLAGRPAERAATVRATLSAVGRLFQQPAPAALGFDPAPACGVGQPSRRGTDQAHPRLHAAA
jgi:hypothetical protein